jgi:hypothetical protein
MCFKIKDSEADGAYHDVINTSAAVRGDGWKGFDMWTTSSKPVSHEGRPAERLVTWGRFQRAEGRSPDKRTPCRGNVLLV